MSQRVKTSARGLVLPRSSSPKNGHLRKKAATCMIEETAATCMKTSATCMIVSTMRLVTIYGLLQPVSVGYHTRESESCLCWILQPVEKNVNAVSLYLSIFHNFILYESIYFQ